MSKNQGLAVAGCNYVGQDQIWKDHVYQEEAAAKKWPTNWDFMTQKYEECFQEARREEEEWKKMVADDFPKKKREKLIPPTPTRMPCNTPLERRVDVRPSPLPVPKTTSQMIGWRSTDKMCQLERYGRYAPPKGGLIKQLNWPTEAIS